MGVIEKLCALQWHAVRLYRVADWLHLKHPALALLVSTINRVVFGVDIAPGARIGAGLVIIHGQGLVVNGAAVLGDRCMLFHGVTIGVSRNGDARAPTIGDDVIIFAGAVVMGPITVGDGARIGANCVVSWNVPSGATVKAQPAT